MYINDKFISLFISFKHEFEAYLALRIPYEGVKGEIHVKETVLTFRPCGRRIHSFGSVSRPLSCSCCQCKRVDCAQQYHAFKDKGNISYSSA